MAIYLIESKADQQKLIDYVGEETAKLFFTMKDRLKSPENDIYYWLKREPKELENRLSDLQSTKTRKQKDEEASEGAELIYNQDGWKVYHITTYEASAKYGKNTQWCITGSKRWDNGENGEHYFNQYTNAGIEFYFYIKDGKYKYALAYVPDNNRYQVFNSEDIEITHTDLSFLPDVNGLPKFSTYKGGLSSDGVFTYFGEFIPIDLRPHIKKIIIPNGVGTIKFQAFRGCYNLTDIDIPDSVTRIRSGAFWECTSLEVISLPNNIISLEDEVFYSCYNLGFVRLPNRLLSIGSNAFEDCTSLKSISIPQKVIFIGEKAFKGCTNLGEVYYRGTPEQWDKVFVSDNNPGLIVCQAETGEVLFDGDNEVRWEDLADEMGIDFSEIED